MAETFRSLRTNLLFMLGDPDKKVILVTSTTSGEGKTFIASNLAVSLALLGKKVVIVGLDIRKPGLNKVFHISHKERGITQYLVAPQSTDLRSMIQSSDLSANLNPSQTTHQTVSPLQRVRTQIIKGPYFNSDSTNTGVPASKSPAYPTHQLPKFNVKL